MQKKEVQEFLREQNEKIKELYVKIQLAYFTAIISGKQEDYKEYESTALEYEKFFHNKENFEKIKEFKKQKASETEKRELDILYLSYLGSQGDWQLIQEITKKSAEIEKKFNTFRAKISEKEYTDNDIREILRNETNSEKLKEAWEAGKQIGKIAEKEVLEIIKLRNQLAKQLGFDNYYELKIEIGEQNKEELIKLFKELENSTNAPFKELKQEIDEVLAKRYKIKPEEMKPWHYHDKFFQEGPEIYKVKLDNFYKKDVIEKAKKYYESIGIDVSDILKKSDLYEKKGKYQHACCMDMNRENDVRIIQNIKNNERWMETTLHELGHAVYNKHLDFSLPFILRDAAHIFTTEAIALLFGRKSRNSEFIKNYGDEKPSEELFEDIKKMLRLNELVFIRWALVMFHFEQELYKAPEQNLNKLWWSLVKKYQLINFSRDEPDWASKIHLVSAPVYYHNYVLGKMLASQLHYHIIELLKLNKETDYSGKKQVGEFLIKNVFKPSAKYKWDEMIKKALGEELTAKYFVEEFC